MSNFRPSIVLMLSTTRARLPTPRTGPRTACVRCLLPGYARRTAWPGNDAAGGRPVLLRPVSRSMSAVHGVREVSTLTLGVATSQRGAAPVVQSSDDAPRPFRQPRRSKGDAACALSVLAADRTRKFLRPLAEPPANVRIIDLGQDHRSGPNAQPHARRRVDVVDSARPGLQTPYGTKDGLACAVSSQGQPAGPHPRGEVMRTGGHPSRY
jgi:hypothetical protein